MPTPPPLTAPPRTTLAPGDRSSSALREVVTAAVVALVASLVAWFRLPATARETMWAEDARVFVQQRLERGTAGTLLLPYDGYLHTVPRLLADLVVRASSVDHLALAVTAASCATAGLVAAAVWAHTDGVLRTVPARLLVAGLTVLVPLAPLEVSGNLANLHWYLLWLTPFVLLHRSRTRAGAALSTLVLVLVGLTEIQALLFLPLLVAGRRPARDWLPGVGLALACGAQVLVAATSDRADPQAGPPSVVQVVLGFVVEPVAGSWVPSSSTAGHAFATAGWGLGLVLAAPFLVALVVGLRSPWRPHRVLVATAASAAAVLWSVDVVVNPSELVKFSFSEPGRIAEVGFARYAVVPSALLLCVVVVALEAVATSSLRRRRAVVAAGTAVLAVGLLWHTAQPHVPRALGPGWSEGVERARAACDDGATAQEVPGTPRGWATSISCDVLSRP